MKIKLKLFSILGWLFAFSNVFAMESAEKKTKESATHALWQAVDSCEQAKICAAIEQGADVNDLNEFGDTPLHRVAACGVASSIDLLAAGADPTIADNLGYLPIHYAASCNQAKFVKELITYIPVKKIITPQREVAFCLLCCFKRFKSRDQFKVDIPKDIQRLLCQYAIATIDVDAIVKTRITWLKEYFAQKVNGRTAYQIFKNKMDNELASIVLYYYDHYKELENLFNPANLDQYRPAICENLEKALLETQLWSNKKG